jgi:hypothetical protein
LLWPARHFGVVAVDEVLSPGPFGNATRNQE